MWADQISVSGDPTSSISGRSVKKETTGYVDDEADFVPVNEHGATDEPEAPGHIVDTPEAISAPLESAEGAADAPPVPSKEQPAVSDEATPSAPQAFPTSDDADSQTPAPEIRVHKT